MIILGGGILEIDLLKLKNDLTNQVDIDETLSFQKDDLKNTTILELKNVHVRGMITRSTDHNYNLSLIIEGIMILPCALTLKPTSHPFTTSIEDDLLTLLKEIDENIKKIENSIDILPIIWENILMEIPIKVVNDDVSSMKIEGNGWKFVTDEETKEVVNSEFEKLKDLF